MICSVHTTSVNGIQGSLIRVECYISSGLPNFEIVGLPDASVKEARERVRSAIKNCGLPFPSGRITLNLSPADVKKTGTHYDLPILIAILAAAKIVRCPSTACAMIGELGLDGTVRPVRGVLSMALAAKHAGIQTILVPAENAPEATLANGPAIIPIRSVRELVDSLNSGVPISEEPIWIPTRKNYHFPDFKDVLGQVAAKRALEIAAAGSHNVLLIGPPGSGKSMLSKRLPSILPDMTWDESLEVTQLYSVIGQLDPEDPLVRQRPFRSPHHTVSNAGLTGGGTIPRPGEISLSHKGVLFLDELPEFRKDTLDLLRQPLEDAQVTISRAMATVTYPAEFMMVCAMNPCKCGWYGSETKRCTCSSASVDAYRSRISGPLLDRIDIMVEVSCVPFEDLKNRAEAEPSEKIKERVDRARLIQNERYGRESGMCNARMGPAEMRAYCVLDSQSTALMSAAFEKLGLTARSYDRILRVARTIADLAGSESIQKNHIAEAIRYRTAKFVNQN